MNKVVIACKVHLNCIPYGWHLIVAAIFVNKLPLVQLHGVGAVVTDSQEAIVVNGGERGGFHNQII
jgi:hypothetical protein